MGPQDPIGVRMVALSEPEARRLREYADSVNVMEVNGLTPSGPRDLAWELAERYDDAPDAPADSSPAAGATLFDFPEAA